MYECVSLGNSARAVCDAIDHGANMETIGTRVHEVLEQLAKTPNDTIA
jgi:hypothetical protein